MTSATTYSEPRRRAGVIGWMSLGAGAMLAAIIVLSALATSQANNAGQMNYQTSAAAE